MINESVRSSNYRHAIPTTDENNLLKHSSKSAAWFHARICCIWTERTETASVLYSELNRPMNTGDTKSIQINRLEPRHKRCVHDTRTKRTTRTTTTTKKEEPTKYSRVADKHRHGLSILRRRHPLSSYLRSNNEMIHYNRWMKICCVDGCF